MSSAILCETYYDAEQKIWSGPKKNDNYNDQMTLGEAIVTVLKLNPQKIIQIDDATKEELTCEELLMNSKKLCKSFIEMGLKIGDVVGLYAANTHYMVVVILATWLSGAAINAAYEKFDESELEVIYKVTKPKIIFCDMENFEIAQKVNQNLNLNADIYIMNGKLPNAKNVTELFKDASTEELQNAEFPCSNVNGDHVAAIMCSLGITGPPKGVMLSHKSLLNQTVFQTIHNSSIAFSFSSVYWISGLITLKESLINGSLRIITHQTFTPQYFMDIIERYQITHIIASADQMTQIYLNAKSKWQTNMKSIDTIICGDSKVSQVVTTKINELLGDNKQKPGFVLGYGVIEFGSLLSMNYNLLDRGFEKSDGKLLPNTQVRIINRDGVTLGPNEHGELQLKFKYDWLGYYNNPKAYKRAFTDNWFSTDDIGYFNDQGFLYVCARQCDIFKTNNTQIYPEKIEEIILQIPGVREVCVFGVPDLVNTNVAACAIVRADNDTGFNLNKQLVYEVVREKLSELYHLKGGIHFVDSIPKTGSGKVRRIKLRDIILNITNK